MPIARPAGRDKLKTQRPAVMIIIDLWSGASGGFKLPR